MAEKEKPEGKIWDMKILRQIFPYVKPYKTVFISIIFLTVLTGVLAPIQPFLIQKTVDDYILSQNFSGLNLMVMLLVGATVIQAGVEFLHRYWSGWLGQTIIRDIRMVVFRHVISLKLRFYDQTPIGRLVTRNISDVETLSNVFTEGIASIIGDILRLVFILVIMFYTDWQLTLICLSMLPLLLISTYIFKEKVKAAFDTVRAAVSNLNAFVQEHITGIAIVQIFNSEERELKKFEEINKDLRTANIKTVLYYSVYFPVAEIIAAMGTGLLIWYGASGVLEERVTLGTLIAFIMYISMFFRPIRMIADRFNTLQLGIVGASRLLKLLDTDERIRHSGNYKPKHIRGNVKFENVSFAYDEKQFVLKDISFEVKEGETVALVGATGAGKSSVINLLSKFYEIQKGKITVDGRDLEDYDLGVMRRHIGVVLQDVFLFSDSITENITLGSPDISLQEVKEAAKLVGAHNFIEKLPDTYAYEVMERGSTLSVGQRQLLSFVRAMVYKPEILILDEATSSVDSDTEELIQEATEKMMEGRTAVVIAHRLATIKKADRIIVLDKGEIKEQGTHSELLEKGGYYATLYEMQYKEAEESRV